MGEVLADMIRVAAACRSKGISLVDAAEVMLEHFPEGDANLLVALRTEYKPPIIDLSIIGGWIHGNLTKEEVVTAIERASISGLRPSP
ncbi:hypothetical protein [Nocardia sp. NPDC058666]|uniref:hypothetical protein n=1 Tax=Nocardia sp. NPDC058666 TaxID=3346587 RepID=UPI00365AA94B